MKTGAQGVAQPESIAFTTQAGVKDGEMQRGYWEKILGIKEYLLCDDCDNGRLNPKETYMRELFYGNAPGPSLKKLPLGKVICSIPDDSTGHTKEVREVEIRYSEVKLFQMSLLWRASIAKGEFFREVDLGPKHENRLREHLLKNDPGSADDYPCLMTDLRLEGEGLESFIQQPTAHRDEDGQRVYSMILGGYQFLYSVSSHPATDVFRCCANPIGKMLIAVGSAEATLRNWATLLKKAGKL